MTPDVDPRGPAGPTAAESDLPEPPGNDDGRTATPPRDTRCTLTLPGAWGAVLAACLSFTPSLLPRGGVIQGVVCGIDAAIGYGLGVLAASIWRAFADRGPREPRSWAWPALYIGGGAAVAALFGLGQYWQHLIRDLMDVTDFNVWYVVAAPFVAVGMFAALLTVGRGLRRLYRATARLLRRWIGARAANTVGWIAVALLTVGVISGVVLDGLVNLANEAFSLRNGDTDSGVEQPTTDLRSGGPGSLIAWDSLGREGRKFIGRGPSAADIGAITSTAASEPIRIYAGLESASSSEARAQLAVDDLVRAGGFERKDLLVATTTGSGWVDPALADSFELLVDGNSATVSMQYSYLPSWLSYLVDQKKAREAGRDLFDAVYERWSALPPGSRPRLFVSGESLGSFGGEAAFSGEYDMRNRTDGIVFAGPPNFNTLFREYRENRDPGSPEIEPVYKQGRTVRFTTDAATGPPPQGRPWDDTRVLYLMHPSDPIVWWSPRLLVNEPAWIDEAPGHDVLDSVVWMPFITFWQVTADLVFSTGVPGGHGHNYTTEFVDGWNAILRPSGLTSDEFTAMKEYVAEHS